jgi:predicted CoA-binding protein
MSARRLNIAGLVIAAFLAFGALFGAALVVDPSGQLLGLPPDAIADSVFGTYLIPGLALLLIVGGTQLAAVVAHARGRVGGALASLVASIVLLGFLGVELLTIQGIVLIQLVFIGVAILQLLVAVLALAARGPASSTERNAQEFLGHRRIAFVGLSSDKLHFSRAVARAFEDRGVEVVPVHPTADQIDGRRAWPRVCDIEDPPAAALLMIPASGVPAAVDDCLRAGVRAVWFHRGAGPGATSQEGIRRAEAAGMLVVRDACPMMFLEPGHWLHATHARVRARRWHPSRQAA